MSSFLSRVKAQFSSSSPSFSNKKSSSTHLSAPSSSSTPSARTPSSTSSAKSPPARQGTISRKISQLSASSSSASPNGSNSRDYSTRSKTPLPTLELSLDEPLSPGGLGLARGESALDLVVNEGDEDGERDDEKDKEILGRSRWTSEQVKEFVELVANKMKERDMSTPGLFLPHVLPSSPQSQQTLLLAYLRIHQPSLFPAPPPITSLTLTPPTPEYLFASELRYTAHVHDLASSLRFSLRHLAPSKDRSDWYDSFSMWEKERNFESNVWAQMGGMNEEVKALMGAVGEVVLGAGALVDRTGVGVAKLARLMAFWVLRDGRECAGDGGEVTELVRVWERLGRRMEHLMLAYIRYQSELGSIPTRLLPLIESYPFRAEGAPQFYPSTNLLGPPPFTTRPRSVLHIKIRSSTSPKTSRSRPNPVYLAEQAFRATASRDARPGQAASLWDSIRERVKSNDDGAPVEFGEVFDGETIRIIKIGEEMYPSRPKRASTPAPVEEPMYRPFGSTLTSRAGSETQVGGASRMSFNRKRSMSQSDIKLLSSVAEVSPGSLSPSSPFSEFGMKSSPYLGLPASSSATEGARGGGGGHPSGTSWAEFSSSGFGETTPASPTSPAASLQVGNGFSLPSTSNPRKLTARSPDMERILANKNNRNSTLMDSPGGSPTTPTFRGTTNSSSTTPTATAPATPTPKAEIDSIEILSIDETFFEWTQDVLLDPELANACNFPVWAVYELGSAITTPSTSAFPSASSEPTWLLISLAHSKPTPSPPAQPAKPAPVEMAALRPAAAANEFGRRSPNGAAATSADKEEKKNRRKSLLSFGSLSGLGRRMSGGASSALEFKEKGKRSASTGAVANPPEHEKAASSVPSTAAGSSTPTLTVAMPAPILARQESAASKTEDEVVDIGRTPSAEPEATQVDAPQAEPVVPIADVTTSPPPTDPSPPIITSSPPRPSTPPFLPLGPILPLPPSPSPKRFSLDRTRTRASISPSLSRSVSASYARPQSPENVQIEQAVDQLVEHLRVGSPVPVERSGSPLGGGVVVGAGAENGEPKEKTADSAEIVPAVPVAEPVPVPEEVAVGTTATDSHADAPQTLTDVAEVVADKVEATLSTALNGVVGLLQEVGVVAASAPGVDKVAPKSAAVAVESTEATDKYEVAAPLSTADASATLDGALAELKEQESPPA